MASNQVMPPGGDATAPFVMAAGQIEPSAFFKFCYGLFVLTSGHGGKDGGCIINTGLQLTDKPKRILIAVNKANFTHELIVQSGLFNLSILTEEAPYALFTHYGFQSGRTIDKLTDGAVGTPQTAVNGIKYLSQFTGAVVSAKVIGAEDYGSHTLFTADVTEAVTLGNEKSMTYQYYFDHVKPKPPAPASTEAPRKKAWKCKICGYVYEGEVLPPDFVCPVCKHGADDFEEVWL